VARRVVLACFAALVVGALLFPAVPVVARPPALELASVGVDGAEGNGSSFGSSISADGRYVAFASSAATLVPGDTNGAEDVFVHDRSTGHTTRVSLSSLGVQGDRDSYDPAISADGRYVAFASFATTLVPGDANRELDVFLHDRDSGATTLVSVASDGAQGDGPSLAPSISGDGRRVAFESDAANLVAGDANRTEDVFVRDIPSGKTTRVSLGWQDAEGQRPSFGGVISADGKVVGFESFAPLVPDDTNRMLDVFVRDLAAKKTTRSSVASGGEEGDAGSFSPALSADGRYVAFASSATGLVPGDRNGLLDVFLHDRETGTTDRVSVASDGGEADGFSFTPALSADGRYIAFPSEATDLVPGDTNGIRDVFVRDVVAGRTSRLGTPSGGGEGNGPSLAPAISASGGVVAFGSFASNLVAGDSNALQDVFVAVPEEVK
jgi:Tol biopolymer transport system component